MTDMLSSKYPNERVTVAFEFGDALRAGETIDAATITVSAAVGTDATPAAILEGPHSVDGSNVLQSVSGGLAGVVYLLLCRITTSDARTLELDMYLPVESMPAGVAPRPTQRWKENGIRYALENIVAPAVEPVTLDEAKRNAKIEHHADDDLIQRLIGTARRQAEHLCGGRAFITSTWRLTATSWPDEVALPVSPAHGITDITYTDTDGTEQTLDPAEYELDALGGLPIVVPAYGGSWPTVRTGRNAAQITFVAGFGAPVDVPEDIKTWILAHVAALYRDRESWLLTRDNLQTVPYLDALLNKYRVMSV